MCTYLLANSPVELDFYPQIAHCQSSIENAELDHAARMKHMWHVRMMSVGIATSASTVVISAWKYIKHRRGNNKRKFFKWWEK